MLDTLEQEEGITLDYQEDQTQTLSPQQSTNLVTSISPRSSISDFLENLGADLKEIERVKNVYPMKVSSYYLSLIKEKGDPIWKQCIPDKAELEDTFNIDDPLQEERDTKVTGLVHRYPDRVLLLISSKCATYCRFCTRKRKVGRINQVPLEQIEKGIEYIRNNKQVRDVILSGGDPLMRNDKEIEQVLHELREIPHLEIIRIGTRIPCVLPSRITKRLCNVLRKYHPLYVNIHFNHPIEINSESMRACELLADAGIPLGSQTVLLKGINDSPDVIKELMQRLIYIRVKPYYLYQCDLVKGVEHFRTNVENGLNIIKKVQGYTSGLCVPHFVIDSPGGGKVPILPSYLKEINKDKVIISNYLGDFYEYPNPREKDNK